MNVTPMYKCPVDKKDMDETFFRRIRIMFLVRYINAIKNDSIWDEKHYFQKIRTGIRYNNYPDDVTKQLLCKVFKMRAQYLSYQAVLFAECIKNDEELDPTEKRRAYNQKVFFVSKPVTLTNIYNYRKEFAKLFNLYKEYANKEDIDRFESTKYLFNYSRLEADMVKVFDELGLDYSTQKSFPDLLGDSGHMRFDGCIYKDGQMLLVECQGEQHYRPIDFFGGQEAFEKTVRYDTLKREYCLKLNIPLLIIRYDQSVKTLIKRFVNRKSYNDIIYEYR